MLRYYHYRKLSPNAQNAYTKIAFALKRYSSAAVIDTVSNLQKVLEAVKNDNPHFFFVDWGSVLYGSRMQAEKTVIFFKYRIQRTVAKQYLEQIKVIAESLKSNSVYATMRKVHDYLAKTVKYNPRVKSDESIYRMNDHNVIGPLFEKMAVCEGIARAYQILLKHLNIECTYMSGYVNTSQARGYHAWNLVRYNGQIKKVDVTWDLNDGKVSHQYFMVPSTYC